MKAEDILEDFEDEYYEGAVYGSFAYPRNVVLEAMKAYAEAKCEEQREICALEADVEFEPNYRYPSEGTYVVDRISIRGANPPKFD